MKNLSLGILLGLSMGSMSIAFADDHFNDKNHLSLPAVSGQVTSLPAGLIPRTHFNDRNVWVYEVPSKGPIQCPVDSQTAAHTDNFNDKYSIQC